jgi:hypothetical protein
VTPEAVDAFAKEDWSALHPALELRPWQQSPLHVLTPESPEDDERAQHLGLEGGKRLAAGTFATPARIAR